MPSISGMLVGRVALVVVGFLMIYVAFFLTEGEENGLDNALERLWHSIEVLESSALSREAALLQQIARIVSSIFDVLFGPRLLSMRAVCVSGCLSVGSLLLLSGFRLSLHPFPLICPGCGFSFIFFAPFAAAGLSIISIPVFLTLNKHASLKLGPIVAFAGFWAWFLVWELMSDYPEDARWSLFLVVPLSIAADFLSIAIARRIVTLIQRSHNLSQMIGLAFITVTLPVFLLWLVVAISPYMRVPMMDLPVRAELFNSALYFVDSNLISGIVGVLFASVLALALIHRLAWPFLRRPVMAAHRHGLLKQRKLLWTIGMGLIALSTPLGGRVMAFLHSHFGL